MDELRAADESRWRLTQQTSAVCDLAGDLRLALNSPAGHLAVWPGNLMAGAAAFGEELRLQRGHLLEATRRASAVLAEHQMLIDSAESGHEEVRLARRELGACRDDLLRAAAATDAARRHTDAFAERLETVEALLAANGSDASHE